ncbi:MAG: hypothetical protein EBT83_15850, partial [Betaproteobacteria bacterium]|nr:hypothetical protein [Betaproteobacteria bacterium]
MNVNLAGNRFLIGNKQAAVLTVSSGALNFTNNNDLFIGGDTSFNTINAANGTLTISGGSVNVSGTGSLVLGVSTNATGTINLDGGTFTTARNITLGNTGTGMTGTVNFNGGTIVIDANSTSFMTGLTAAYIKSGGAIINTAKTNTIGQALLTDTVSTGGGLTKLGTGTLTLAGANTYTGATLVNAGTLVYNGTNTSTATTVGSGATLMGSGSIGNVTVNSGGTISPGNSPGTLTVGAVTFGAGGNYNWQIYDATAAAGGYDLLSGTSLNITADATTKFNLNLWSLSAISPSDVNGSAINFANTNSYSWTIGTFSGGITNFNSSYFSINTASTNGTGGFANSLGGGSFALAATNNNLVLSFTPLLVNNWTNTANANWSVASAWSAGVPTSAQD